MSKRRKTLSEEDHILWEKVKHTVQNVQHPKTPKAYRIETKATSLFSHDHDEKIGHSAPTSKAATKDKALPKPEILINPDQLFSGMRISSAQKPEPKTSQTLAYHQVPHHKAVDPATRKRIVKGRMPIDATLDLHGLTQDQARSALVRFVQMARNRGDRTIIVVTGKGSSPQSEGILRRMVPLWLRQGDFQNHISGFSSAARHHGGEGAFYLRLKKLK